MKVLIINVVCGIRSTGRICTDLATALEKQGHEVKIAYGRETVPEQFEKYAVRIGTSFDVKLHGFYARTFDKCGFGSKKATENFIAWVKEYNPDIIHMHNLHGYYINVSILFDYLKTCRKKVIWTLHDCWAFTGHAAYCESVNCNKWIEGCNNCPKIGDYPKAFSDNSRSNWINKRTAFSGVPNLQIVTPSDWLASLVEKSYLNQYSVTVIRNGVDIRTFKPTNGNIKEKLRINDKKIILGVAALWEPRKGLNDFISLSKMISEDYVIVLVGLSKAQIAELPNNVIGLERTDSPNELAELYTSSEVYINPTYEDNYPTTNLEAIACGTPVITYRTGGSGESATMNGIVVEKGDVESILKALENLPSKTIDPNVIGIDCFVEKYLNLFH